MNKPKKIILLFTLLAVIILSFFIGKFTESTKYHVALAGCQKSQLPNGNYATIKIDNSPIKQMFENYYSPNLDFIEYYIP
jgi:pyocin large subunit-like protein